MKKFFLLTMASLMTVFAMAVGRGDGSTKANAIDFDWEKGVQHPGGNASLWYRVNLDTADYSLYSVDNPSLTLYLTNPSRDASVDVSMEATLMGETESRKYTIAAHQFKTFTANAATLVRMKQKELYLELKATGKINLSAKVFETSDLDETCKDAKELKWNTKTTQSEGFVSWWKVDLTPAKEATKKDVQVTITNEGTQKVNLVVGVSTDCPSSGLTKETKVLNPGKSVVKTVPQSMIKSLQSDEVYVSIENLEAPVSMKIELVDQPVVPVINDGDAFTDLDVEAKIESLPVGTTLYRLKVSEMNSRGKYEPEFTYRNVGTGNAKVTVKTAFSPLPVYSTNDNTYTLSPNEEEVVVYKKNMLDGLEGVEYVYLQITVEGTVNLYGRFKHVREGKACKTNIDFNWETGHSQEARTTQWYAVSIAEARENVKDIMVYVQNFGDESAKVKASVAFSCPYVDLQEVTRTIANGAPVSRRLKYSSFAMMDDTVYIGLETNQNIKFWATTVDAEKKAEADTLCLHAVDFNWEEGVRQAANDTVWYRIDVIEAHKIMDSLKLKYPTITVQNNGSGAAHIVAELSAECPDSIANESRKLTIEANGAYTKQISSNLLANITYDEVYVRVITDQDIHVQVTMTEKPAGSDCSSAIPFNWVSGNVQDANANLWYQVDLRDVMKRGNDLKLNLKNNSKEECTGVIQLAYGCPVEVAPSVKNFKLKVSDEPKTITVQNSAFETLDDSVVYVNVQATKAIHFWADTLPVQAFDTITGEGITLIPLKWDTVYTQKKDTEWYIIPKSEIDLVRNLDEQKKPVAHLWNDGTDAGVYQVEAAFAFPIVKKMMTKSQKLAAGKHFSDTIPASTFNQILNRKNTTDSIIIRVTRKSGTGDFRFRAELVKAFTGNSRYDALPLEMNKTYTQGANTEMWYQLKPADWKKNKDLFDKSLHVVSKNAGAGQTTVSVAAYEGLLSEKDWIEYYRGKEGKRTLKKGFVKSRNIPAQAVYALGNAEFYVRVRTTDSIVFSSSFQNYEPLTEVDPNQQKAKMLVPNVDYTLPADTTMWFLVCAPYMQNNFRYMDAANVEYELEGNEPDTIEITATFQDTLTYKVPVRTRVINKSGKERKGSKTLKELFNEAMKRKGREFDISGFEADTINDYIKKFITSDSVTGYVRVRSSKPIKLRLNTLQVTGDSCLNPMEFDWEHGNVSEAKRTNLIHVKLDTLNRIPAGKDLLLHMENWSTGATNMKAIISPEGCDEDSLGSVSRVITTDTTKRVSRALITTMNLGGLMIKYNSDSATHIWAEIVPAIVDTIDTTFDVSVCAGTEYLIDTIKYVIKQDTAITVQSDSIDKANAKYYIVRALYNFKTFRDVKLVAIDSLGANIPVVTKGAVLDCTLATDSLRKNFAAQGDTVKVVGAGDSIRWEYTLDGTNFQPIPTTPLTTAAIGLRYVITTQCDDQDTSAVWQNIPVSQVIDTAGCQSFSWDLKPGSIYTTDATDTIIVADRDGGWDMAIQLNVKIHQPLPNDTTKAGEVKDSYTWSVNDSTYTKTPTSPEGMLGYDVYVKPGKNGECDTTYVLELTIDSSVECQDVDTTVSVAVCDKYDWTDADTTITTPGTYTHVFTGAVAGGCDSIVTLEVKIRTARYDKLPAENACKSYTWNINEKTYTYTTSGDYNDTIPTKDGQCDSVITTLPLTIITTKYDTVKVGEPKCHSYHWELNDQYYYETGLYNDTIFGGATECDSIITLDVTINNAIKFNLEAVSYYGNRLLVINRRDIIDSTGWQLDSIYDPNGEVEVLWYEVSDLNNPVGEGYYLLNEESGDPLVGTYFAVVKVPSSLKNCGYEGYTKRLVCEASATAAPALIPNMVRGGENIRVVNLDPEKETTIRIYTTEGLVRDTYTVSGEDSFVIKAAAEHGFYLVELRNEDLQTTLRYIVK